MSITRFNLQILQCSSCISHNAPLCNRCEHLCTFPLLSGELWDIFLMHCGICEMNLCCSASQMNRSSRNLWWLHEAVLESHVAMWYENCNRVMSTSISYFNDDDNTSWYDAFRKSVWCKVHSKLHNSIFSLYEELNVEYQSMILYNSSHNYYMNKSIRQSIW